MLADTDYRNIRTSKIGVQLIKCFVLSSLIVLSGCSAIIPSHNGSSATNAYTEHKLSDMSDKILINPKLSHKKQNNRLKKQLWNKRVATTKKILDEFKFSKKVYDGWRQDYIECARRKVVKLSNTYNFLPQFKYWKSSGYGLNPHKAYMLLPPKMVESCVVHLKHISEYKDQRLHEQRKKQKLKNKLVKCKNSQAARQYKLARTITDARSNLKNAQKRLEKEREVLKITGTTNVLLKHRMGEVIVTNQRKLKRALSKFHKSYGYSVSPEDIVKKGYPCKIYQKKLQNFPSGLESLIQDLENT